MAAFAPEVRRELGVCGIATIPNQVHYLVSYSAIAFNVLLMGDINLGKTSLINRVLGKQVFSNDLAATFEAARRESDQIVVRVREQGIVEDDIKASIRLVDAPQIGYSVQKSVGYAALCSYIKDRLGEHSDNELAPNRTATNYQDSRIHLCLYFLTPHQHELSAQDITSLKEVSQYTNTIVVGSKADMMTSRELNIFSDHVARQCTEHKLPLFSPSETEPPTIFATSSRSWEGFCYQPSLEKLLIKSYFPMLLANTEKVYYERFRRERLQTTGTATVVGMGTRAGAETAATAARPLLDAVTGRLQALSV